MDSVVKLNRKLGVGGRGIVYEGFDHAKGHFVAVKEMPYMEPSVAGEEDAELAEILSELACMREAQHPNLVQYYGARRSAVGVQIIMEYVSGGSLDYVLTRCGPLRESVARAYTRDVLTALQYLHEVMHVCHRDVKPANILITPEGRCKLADFGVAKHVEEDSQATVLSSSPRIAPDGQHTGADSCDRQRGATGVREGYLQTAVGTPWYMAPEVINGGVDDEDEDDEDGDYHGDSEHYTQDSALDKEYGEACAEWETHAPTSSADGALEDWSAEGPTTDFATHSPAPHPPPLFGPSYYNPLKHILRKGRLARASVGYTTRADIWSVGVTVYEMITGTRPFGADLHNPSAVMFRIANCATSPPRLPAEVRVSATLQNFLDLCFVYDKELRATARELLGHPWLRGVVSEPAGVSAPVLHRLSRSGSSSLPREMVSLPARALSGQNTLSRHRQQQQFSSSSSSSPAQQQQPTSVRQSVFDGVPLLDALDLPAYPPITHLASTREGSTSSTTLKRSGCEEGREGAGAVRGRPSVRRLSTAGLSCHHHAYLTSSSTITNTTTTNTNTNTNAVGVEPLPVSPSERAEASSRYAAARQRIGHTRSSASRAPLGQPTSNKGHFISGGGLQTKHGAYVDLLAHP